MSLGKLHKLYDLNTKSIKHKAKLLLLIIVLFDFFAFRNINGVATLGSLKAKVLKGTVKPSDAVDKAAYHTFKKVTLDTSLEKLDRILDKEHFALVVHSQRLCKYGNYMRYYFSILK